MTHLDNLKDPFPSEAEDDNGLIVDSKPEEVKEAEKTDKVDKVKEVEKPKKNNKPDQVKEIKKPKKTKEVEKADDEFITICVDFPKHATPVECIIAATGYRDKIAAAGKELRLLQNRLYMIPVDCDKDINSDDWSGIKIMSDISGSIDVRFIKDGLACVMPLAHNVKIRQGNRLAILW